MASTLRVEGAPPLRPRVTFPSRGKSPKARQGLRPLESSGAKLPPFSRSLTHRAGLVCATEKDRFATLRWWANRSLLFPLALTRKNILLLIRGAGHLVARLDATFGGIRGIGGGVFCVGRGIIVQRSQGNEVWFDWCKTKSDAIEQQFIHKVYKISDARCRFVADLVAARNGLVKPKNTPSATKATNFYKKRFYKKGYI